MDNYLLSFLGRNYPLDSIQVVGALATNGQRAAYQVETDQGPLVLKVSDPGRAETTIQSDVGILDYLAGCGFPAPAPLPARDGRLYLPYHDRFVYFYTYIEGEHPLPGPELFEKLGHTLAHLHSLPTEGFNRPSPYQPRAAIAELFGYLDAAPPEPEQQHMARELRQIAEQLPSFEGLPQGLIHTDPYLFNLVQHPSGTLYLIDWDDGGISYPLLDVVYSAHLCTYPRHEALRWQVSGQGEDKYGLIWKPEWMRTFLAAYQAVRPLSDLEKELFAAAMRLNFLVYIWDWGARRLIPENYERMKILDRFSPWEE